MLKNFQHECTSHNVFACIVAVVLISAILLAFVAPISDGGFDRLTLSLPVAVFRLLTVNDLEFDWFPSGKSLAPICPFVAASAGRAPPG